MVFLYSMLFSDLSEDSGVKSKLGSPHKVLNSSCPPLPPADYDEGPPHPKREHSVELSEDTDYDGSSLPEDSPEVLIKALTLNSTHLHFTF